MPLAQPQSIRTIFFDAGFTLLRPYPSTAEVCQQVCRQLDLHIHLDELQQALADAEDYFLRQVRRNRQTWASDQAIEELWIGYYMNLLRPFVEEHDERRLFELAKAVAHEFDEYTSWQCYPDVLPTLEVLRAHGYTLGVISDWGIALSQILRRLKLTRYFDCAIISAATRHAKPSPTLYEMALQRVNAVADYTLHIGDSYIHDVLGARSVDITPILLDRARKLTPASVDCLLVHSLDELLDLLELEK
ncbi:MAG: HAD hydrolase-like protein [Ktedonobacteraceae bacterium]|nr:HAD hydrolase-like protein [Ktedonobacteraceae bacterium]